MNTYIKIVKNKKIKNIQLTKKSKTLYNDIDIEICQSTRTNQTASIQPKPPEDGTNQCSVILFAHKIRLCGVLTIFKNDAG